MTQAPTIFEALAAVMADVSHVAKRDENTHQHFRFRGIDAVVNAVGPALRTHRVIVVPHVEEVREDVVEVGRNRSRMGHVTVLVAYRFHGPAGDHIECRVAGEAMDSGDKAVPKAMSVAFRTALLQALALPTDEPDPDASTYERAPAGVTAAQAKRDLVALATEVGKDDPKAAAADVWRTHMDGHTGPVTDDQWATLEEAVRS